MDAVRHEAIDRRSLRAARLAVLAIFFLSGFGFGNWAVRIPAVQERLGLGEGLLGLALLGMAVGSLVSMPLAGGLISRLGSRRVVGATALAYSLMLPLLAVAPNLALLVASLALVGAATGSLDVSMNAQAVAVEKGLGHPIMSSFHAAFSLGGLAGAAAGGTVAAAGIGVAPHLTAVAGFSLVAFVFAYRLMLPAGVDRGEGGEPAFARPTRALAGLGIISFCVLLGEGAMADWSAVYLSGTLGTAPGGRAGGLRLRRARVLDSLPGGPQRSRPGGERRSRHRRRRDRRLLRVPRRSPFHRVRRGGGGPGRRALYRGRPERGDRASRRERGAREAQELAGGVSGPIAGRPRRGVKLARVPEVFTVSGRRASITVKKEGRR